MLGVAVNNLTMKIGSVVDIETTNGPRHADHQPGRGRRPVHRLERRPHPIFTIPSASITAGNFTIAFNTGIGPVDERLDRCHTDRLGDLRLHA